MKIVINVCHGGFGISPVAARYMAERGHAVAAAEVARYERDQTAVFYGYGYAAGCDGYKRDDPLLVEAVEQLGSKANGSFARLKVVEIPDGVAWEISDYDGYEHVAEQHRTWG